MATILVNNGWPTNPATPGGIKVTSAGTPLPLSNNYTDLKGKNIMVNWVKIIADPAMTNGHYIYVLGQKVKSDGTYAAADTTNFLNILAKLSAGQVWDSSQYLHGNINLDDIQIDVTNANDIAFVTVQNQ